MRYVDRQLGPGEQIVFRTRLHPVVLTGAVTFAVFVAAVAALIIARNELAPSTIRWLCLGAAALAAVSAAPGLLRWWLSDFAVTNRRLLARAGWRLSDVVEVSAAPANAVAVEPTLVGRLLDYGTVRITVAGGGEVFPRVARANALRDAYVRQARPSAATRAR